MRAVFALPADVRAGVAVAAGALPGTVTGAIVPWIGSSVVSLVEICDVRPVVAPVQRVALLPREVPATVPQHVSVVSLVAAQEAERAV